MTEVTPSLSQSMLPQLMEQLSAVDGKIGVLQGQANVIIKVQENAATGREVMYDKMNAMDVVAAEVKRLTPLVDGHEKKQNQATGAMWLGKTLWAVCAGAIG